MLKNCLNKNLVEAGCDEAGRGCLSGPVVAAAVILPVKYRNKELNDSKKLSEKQRYELREEIEKVAIAWSWALVDNTEIDEINILNASFLAMHRAVDKLHTKPEFLLIDGNRFNPYPEIKHKCIIKGDGKYLNIAAASILAKTYRDDLMQKLHLEYPRYGWDHNKGYPTEMHREAISMHGTTKYHRMSFTLLPDQLELEF
ncbi:MAG: ribonuclease HII [Bacteroidia bacterium]